MRTEHWRFYSACTVFTVGSGLRPKKQFSHPRLVAVRCALRRNVSCESSTGACCADDDGPISARVRRFALSVSFHLCSLLMFGSYITDAYKLEIIASLVTAALSVATIKQVKSILTIGLFFILIRIC
jgi:hypothetical protein